MAAGAAGRGRGRCDTGQGGRRHSAGATPASGQDAAGAVTQGRGGGDCAGTSSAFLLGSSRDHFTSSLVQGRTQNTHTHKPTSKPNLNKHLILSYEEEQEKKKENQGKSLPKLKSKAAGNNTLTKAGSKAQQHTTLAISTKGKQEQARQGKEKQGGAKKSQEREQGKRRAGKEVKAKRKGLAQQANEGIRREQKHKSTVKENGCSRRNPQERPTQLRERCRRGGGDGRRGGKGDLGQS